MCITVPCGTRVPNLVSAIYSGTYLGTHYSTLYKTHAPLKLVHCTGMHILYLVSYLPASARPGCWGWHPPREDGPPLPRRLLRPPGEGRFFPVSLVPSRATYVHYDARCYGATRMTNMAVRRYLVYAQRNT